MLPGFSGIVAWTVILVGTIFWIKDLETGMEGWDMIEDSRKNGQEESELK